MKKSLLFAFCLAYVFIVNAGPVSEKQALEKARQFMPGKSFSMSNISSHARTDNAGITPYYIFNAGNNAGFVIVSGDDRTKAILGYSDSGAIDVNAIPDNVEGWLDYYAEAISSLGDSPVTVKSEPQTAKRKNIAPLVQTTWGQGSPYNGQCVFDGDQCVTGCVATAMAQVVNYYQYPNKVAAIDGYTTSANGYDVPALPSTTLDWKNICDSYGYNDERTDAQKAAVATLMRYCGQSVQMNYGPGSSGAVTGYIASSLVEYFGYAEGAQMLYRDYCETDEEWENIIYQELSGKHPIVYRGRREGSGHAFVVDGYKDGLYHVNWGWSGSCDGYFELTVMNATPDRVYNMNHGAIIGVRPLVGKVKLSKTKATIETGKTLTLKPTVSPEELLDKSVTWKSSNKKVATVTSSGKVKGVAAGTATITCTSQVTGAKATCKVTVGSITLSKSEAVVKKGSTLTLKATLTPSSLSDKSVTWKSSDTSIATVTSGGKVKGVKVGTATVTCTSNATGLSTTCKVTVGLVSLTKYKMSLRKGKTETLKATVYPSSLSDKSVTWTSSNKKVATVTSAGKVKGVKEGTATITCTSKATGLSRTCEVTVGDISLSKSEAVVKKGKTVTLKATVTPSSLSDKSVTWTSSDEKVATVSSSGKVKGVKVGIATITCTSNATGLSTTCKVTVGLVTLNKYELTLKKGKTETLTATVYPSSLTDKSVTWTSSNTKVATVTSEGKVKGIKAGTATITCTSVATGLSRTCEVTVTASTASRSTEGDDDEVTGIETIEEAPALAEPYDVYDLSGRKVLDQVTSLDGLPNGIYIVNGKKVLKK